MRYYSKSTDCTYLDRVHSVMPDDVIEISDALYQEVFANPMLGKVRSVDESGLPILIDPPGLTSEERDKLERSWRDEQINTVLWLRERHRDQLDLNQTPSLTTEQFSGLLIYIRNLRDWPQSPDFPSAKARPIVPSWIAEQPQ
ncbi:phage tail protein [Pseudomonas atagonensis]|uniref:phage tail protein n=1 Tax=Pseudomonas atagonensis TaxID=2609964 RepID=UPI00140BF12B|nr:phage tail protein [Pseudomonas atagonensis]